MEENSSRFHFLLSSFSPWTQPLPAHQQPHTSEVCSGSFVQRIPSLKTDLLSICYLPSSTQKTKDQLCTTQTRSLRPRSGHLEWGGCRKRADEAMGP